MKKMKRISLLSMFLVFALFGWAQTLNESFDGTTFPPTGWQNIQVSGSGLWNRATSGTDPACLPHSGAAMARYNSYDFNVGINAILVSPALTFSGSTPHALNFWKYADSGWNIYPDSIGVYYNSTASLTGATWLATIPRYNPVDGWYKHGFLLPASLTGTKYIIFRGYSQYGNNMFIDDVTLDVPLAHDASTVSIDNNMYLSSTTPTIPTATIKNLGINTETSMDVTCKIFNYSNAEIYSNTQTIPSLASYVSTSVNFASFTLPNAEGIYKMKVYTSVVGDLNHTNDTIVKTVYTYTHNKQAVLLEVGTGTWCQYCPGAAMGADDLVTNGHHVAVVENHNGDTYAYTASDARNSYYGINSFPTAVFDGVKKLAGGNHTTSLYTTYLPMYQGRYDIKTAFGITLTGYYVGNTYTMSVVVDRYGDSPFANSNLVLHLALTQSHITYSWQGQTHLEYVSRLMTPSATGTPINLQSVNQVTVPLTFDLNAAWGGSIANHDFEIVAWVQDLTTKEVVDAQKIDLNLVPVSINEINAANINVYPNPASNYVMINNAENANVQVYDILGNKVLDLNNISNNYKMDVSSLSQGSYVLKIVQNNQIVTKRISLVN